MPPNIRSAIPKTLSRPLDSRGVFYCPSCATWRRTLSTRRNNHHRTSTTITSSVLPRRGRNNNQRYEFTTAASPSVVNAGKNVPPRFRELYAALNRVGDVAAERVNLSRLQLALRGLEVEEPLVRVAVLGLNDTNAARRLVRLLLSDPLAPRGEWEDLLDGYDADISRGLLIRYGEVSESIPNNLLPTISIPSPLLKKGNLEILVTSLGTEADQTAHFTADTFLVPTVTIRTSHSGRHNMVRYPVHKSIVCGSGVDDLVAYSGLIARSDLKREAKSVYGAIEMAVSGEKKNNDRIAFVDINQANEALDKFRESVSNASLYEHGWNNSGVQPVVDWLAALREDEGRLDPSLKTLIQSLLDAAEEGVLVKEAQRLQEQQTACVSEKARADLDRSVAMWAEEGHSELRSSLEAGFSSKRWKGLAWWKLFWRVDDVGMITSEILEKRYLHEAERKVIWTAGQFQQAGLIDRVEESAAEDESSGTKEESTAPEKTALEPWPTQIPTSRARLLDTTVPALQALAQRLVLFSMSTTTLTSALSALTYISLPAASVYETCTMAAVGLMYSLRRQQTKWESARTFWEEEVREEGRTALLKAEEELRTIVREGGRPGIDISDVNETKESIEQARRAVDGDGNKST